MPQYRLLTLGSLSLEDHSGAALPGQRVRRRLALLAVLAASGDRGRSRDWLLALFWPDTPADRARHSLEQLLYAIRGSVDNAAFLGVNPIALNPQVIESDVAEFERALAENRLEEAVALYRGPFLDGFILPDAPEFGQWADGERARLANAYARALEVLADAAERQRDFRGAVEWWERRAAHDPYDSRVAQCLMRALDASGNRARAIQHAAVHERLLRDELDVQPPAELTALVERMRREPLTVSPALATPVSIAEAPPRPGPRDARVDPVPPASAAPPRLPESAGKAQRRRMRAGALALLVAAVAVGLVYARRPATPSSTPARSIAVLPFVNMSPDGENEYFSDGITEEIITQLSAVPTLKVISRTSAMRYKGTTKSLRQIAEELRVAHVLEGSVRREGDKVRITAQLIDAAADHHLWSRTYDRELVDVFAIQNEIAREVGRALEVELGEGNGVHASRGTRDPQAYELYRRGRFLWRDRTPEGHELAIQYYRRAIERDSNFAEPYAGLADAYLTAYQFNLSSMPEAEVYSRITWAAERALALDDRSADAHTSFAIALWWQRNWPGAERELRRAIELNPGHVTARGWYTMLLLGMGRIEEAEEQSRRASELDPFAVLITWYRGWVRYVARDFDGAIEQFQSALEINDSWAPTYASLTLAYAQKGMHEAAVRAASKALEVAPRSTPLFVDRLLADLAYAQALAGRTGEARESLQRAKKMNVSEPLHVARAHVALGEPDSAFAWLERSNWRWPHRAALADPALDPVRSDPRFAQLSTRVAREMGIH
jgi:TolB-like protein/DNA-binding SARP family transcriptional activator/Tfp pilus assembly protein PilF